MGPNPAKPQPTSSEAALWAKLKEHEAALAALQTLSGGGTSQVAVVDVLPAAGRLGRSAVLSTDGKLYIDDGTTWNAQT